MIFIPKQDKKEDLLIFDLKMRRIRYICPKITQNFHYQIKNLTPLESVKVFNSKTHQELKEKLPPTKNGVG